MIIKEHMAMIKVLEKNIADKIAAGEVIERPISIVKELVENSIDAGATSIVVEIKNGGKSYIRVTDDGCGIEKSQVETAFLRHATSKIETAKDLDAIETLGFRGEALASIAAVSHTEIVTKTEREPTGTRLLIYGGEILANTGIGCPTGTTLIVTDLFYNTPARLKFLKSDSGESGIIIDFMSEIALAYKDIKFRLINNGNILFSTNGKGDRFSCLLSIYKQRELEGLVPVSYSDGSNVLEGYISTPALSKTTRRSQIFFVNGRVVKSKILEKGVDEGYRERLFPGRYPIVFLFLQTSPEDLDVNIHPNKRDVRFDKEGEIIEFIARGIKDALGTKEAVVNARKVLGNAFKEKAPERVEELKAEKNINNDKSRQVDVKSLLSTLVAETPNEYTASQITPAANPAREGGHADAKGPTSETFLQRPAETGMKLEPPTLKPFDFIDLTLTGVIFGTYITATDDRNFYLIDQHAAHERIFYEKLVGQYMASEKYSQPILTPIIIDVSLSAKENEYSWLDSLAEMGYSIEEFGQNSYIIKEIPTYMEIGEAEEFVKVFLENINESTNLSNTIIIDKLIMKSCKSAVKARDYLSMDEVRALMKDLANCVNPFSCPHGRPTFIKLSNYDIEKMFKRV